MGGVVSSREGNACRCHENRMNEPLIAGGSREAHFSKHTGKIMGMLWTEGCSEISNRNVGTECVSGLEEKGAGSRFSQASPPG